MHQVGQLPHHAFVCAKIVLLGQHEAEIKDKLVAVIANRFHADWVAQDTVSVCANLEQVSAELLAGNHEERDVGEGQEEGLCRGSGGGNDGPVGDLVDDFGTLEKALLAR